MTVVEVTGMPGAGKSGLVRGVLAGGELDRAAVCVRTASGIVDIRLPNARWWWLLHWILCWRLVPESLRWAVATAGYSTRAWYSDFLMDGGAAGPLELLGSPRRRALGRYGSGCLER